MSTQEYIRSITETIPDDFPTLTPLPEGASTSSTSSSASSITSFFSNITWQTWLIIILILALLGINIFAYLAKGTQEGASIFGKVFGPILSFFGYNTLETTKQTVQTSATGTKAGVDIVAGATTGAIDTVQDATQNGLPMATTGTSVGLSTSTTPSSNNTTYTSTNTTGNMNVPQGSQATSSLPVQNNIQQAGANIDQWQQDSLERALSNAAQSSKDPEPDNSRSTIQSTGKSGWCFIGEDQGIRTCAEIGVNDGCMSGDVFPNQAICMNPNLRA
jgi:ABC-type Na+ efflux pump permease subunit